MAGLIESEDDLSLAAKVAKLRGSFIQRVGWDSYGATAISDQIIDAAQTVAELLQGHLINGTLLTLLVPTADGGIAFCNSDESVCVEVSLKG